MLVHRTNSTRRARRAGKAAVAAALALIPLTAACEVTSEVPLDCTLIGRITPTLRSNASPDSVAPGASITHEIAVTMPEIVTDVPVTGLTISYPLPDRISRVDSVTFTGGNIDGSWQIEGSRLVLGFRGNGVSSANLDIPVITIEADVATDAPGGTMAWAPPQSIAIDIDFFGSPVAELCTVVPATPEINNTNIDGPENPGYTPGTVGSPPTATTWANSAYTTTTSANPTTTTWASTTTNLNPTTTTTVTPGTTTTTTGQPQPSTTTTQPPPNPNPNAPAYDASTTLTCSILGPTGLATGTVHAPDTVAPGSTVRITTVARPGTMAVDAPVVAATLTYPLPAGLTVESITFDGLPGTWRVEGSDLIVRIDGGGTSSTVLELPVLTINARVASSASGSLVLRVPSRYELDVNFLGTPIRETCTNDAPQTVLETITVG